LPKLKWSESADGGPGEGRRKGLGGLGGVVLTAVLGEDVGAVLAAVLGDPGLAPGDPAHGESRSRHHPLLGLLRAHG
jgi:hypothetical protein